MTAPAHEPDRRTSAANGDAIYIQKHHLTLQPIRPGSLRQGAADGYSAEKPVRIVDLTFPFWIGEHLITQRQYAEVMLGNPSYFPSLDNPVETVRWYDAVEYCRRLTALQRAAGTIGPRAYFRLPTEAEWEYCCRTTPDSAPAWTGTPPDDADVPDSPAYCYGNDPEQLSDYAWYGENSNQTTHPVGEKKPCAWNLYDMHGNVAEWCQDWFADYAPGRIADPCGPDKGGRKVRRGGGWSSTARRCRATDRIGVAPDCQCALIGFRIVLCDVGEPPYPTDHLVW